MPRVTTHTARQSKYARRCTGCGQEIEVGQRFFHWTRRVGPKQGSFRHVECGPPRPTELTSRKTAQVDEAVGDYTTPEVDFTLLDGVDFHEPPETVDLDVGAFEDAVSGVTDIADSVADEYEEGASNMPDSLQSSPTYEAMEDVAQRLRDWAEEIREKATEELTVDLPARGPDESAENWLEAARETYDTAWAERASEIDDLMGDVPEYEG